MKIFSTKFFLVFIFSIIFQNLFSSSDQIVRTLELSRVVYTQSNTPPQPNPKPAPQPKPAPPSSNPVPTVPSFILNCMNAQNQVSFSIDFSTIDKGASSGNIFQRIQDYTKSYNLLLHIQLIGSALPSGQDQYTCTVTGQNPDTLQPVTDLSFTTNPYTISPSNAVSSGYIAMKLNSSLPGYASFSLPIAVSNGSIEAPGGLSDFYVGIYDQIMFVIPSDLPSFQNVFSINNAISIDPIVTNLAYFNFNYNVTATQDPEGYSFLKNPWTNVTVVQKAPAGISQVIQGLTTGQSFTGPFPSFISLLAFDKTGMFISDFSKNNNPYVMVLCIFDSTLQLMCPPVPFPASNNSGTVKNGVSVFGESPSITTNTWQFGYNANGTSVIQNYTYPSLITTTTSDYTFNLTALQKKIPALITNNTFFYSSFTSGSTSLPGWVTQTTPTIITEGSGFNINVPSSNGLLGYAFGNDPWNSYTSAAYSGGKGIVGLNPSSLAYQSMVATMSSPGVYLVLLAFDANYNLILDISTQAPVYFGLYAYDYETDNLLAGFPISFPASNSQSFPSNNTAKLVELSGLGQAGVTLQYPGQFFIYWKPLPKPPVPGS